MTSGEKTAPEADLDLNRDRFLRSLIRTLAGTLENVVGLDEAEGYISIVGNTVGRDIDSAYREALQVDLLDREQVADVMVDLKARIEGDFYIIEQTDDRIVVGNRKCPFGDFVKGRPSLCMMTSNVFGRIAADNLGYAGVTLEETIAEGHSGCRVVIRLKETGETPANERVYYRAVSSATE